MTIFRLVRIAASASLLTLSIAGCVVAGGYGGNVGVGVDYYEPVGGVYGAWGPGYQVGPYRDRGHFWGGGAGHHAYHSAAPGRSVPSIPFHSR
ncbi:hypothetical protein [Solimicrobium silvestre]|uniref:Lipoprotein n=1 Tax=Solimicrobium silvestre TaxID=2099400 RepID=A0A2S9GSX7_9BURK|nr:hypothetical protein [Solimicrobium silvestre]PRC90817.1 hypothetical protein S2091_4480 [Solimicrobium silvestre]